MANADPKPDFVPGPEEAVEDPPAVSRAAALVQLRAFITDNRLGPGDRLPAERQLCVDLGLSRSELRKALETLVEEGMLWRHVGKGTFLSGQAGAAGSNDLSALAKRISPADVMRARAALEPAIARDAALHSSAAHLAEIQAIADRSRAAATWREYEALDNDFHRQIAEGSGSVALLALFDQLNILRRMIAWGRLTRSGARPPVTHPSFAEHDRISEALAERDPDIAQSAMRTHLRSVEERLFKG